jgi:ABC-type multidrug transport system permease subunit
MALIAGSCFYNSPDTSAGLFTKGGAVFFSLLYNCIVAMSEVTESFKGRPILTKHKSFAMYHPAAFCLAQITADFPVLLFQCTIFSVVIYWMVGLKHTAAAFFTFWAILFTTTLVSTYLQGSQDNGLPLNKSHSFCLSFCLSLCTFINMDSELTIF